MATDPNKAKKTAEKKTTGKTVKSPAAQQQPAKKAAARKTATAKKSAPKTAKEETAILQPAKKTTARKAKVDVAAQEPKRIVFQLRFRTSFGQQLFITGDHPLLGDNDLSKAVPLQYFNEECWHLSLELKDAISKRIHYHYILRNPDGVDDHDAGRDKFIDPSQLSAKELLLIDTWNHAGFIENVFDTKPFREVLLPQPIAGTVAVAQPGTTHTFKVKAPLLGSDHTLCMLGSCASLSDWDTQQAVRMHRDAEGGYFTISLNLTRESFPIAYKYGVYDMQHNSFVCFEAGDNRVLFDNVSAGRQTVLHDGFAALPNDTWKGAGIAVPVFSLRSAKSFGTGEFSDIRLLADWLKQTGIKLVQVLPVNDTTATYSWKDSYPYSAVSAFALHPLYMDLSQLATGALKQKLAALEPERLRLNALPAMDYEAVTHHKRAFIAEAYRANGAKLFRTASYKSYFERNRHWLVPYAVFCYLRDLYGTADVQQWPAYNSYDASATNALAEEHAAEIGLHYFTQYHLHAQLQDATGYARSNGIIVKGDIPIGVSRHSADAWQAPQLYHMEYQAGAPPDDFAVKGQNWGFPTYHWQRMLEDGFAWWKQRFAQMDVYFDAFRIDHILGFFRIWSIPMDAVEGIMGHFVPALPVHISEFSSRGISFEPSRYVRPFINDAILRELFGEENEAVKAAFLDKDASGHYHLKPAFDTQRKIQQHFAQTAQSEQQRKTETGLYDLVSNVILFEAEDENGPSYHFRFNMEHISSFRYLDESAQYQLKALYVDYFFRRQESLWRRQALQKLPELKRATRMLVCGEDLGLIPACVPDVMKQAGLLSLEIQRMPKDDAHEFFHPAQAPYLSVVTPSTHDMSTIRGWWEEDRARTQRFFNQQLGQQGEAPEHAAPWINKAIVLQHLYSPAMWSIFQVQDLLGMDETLRGENIHDERINIPADPQHYWRYRMPVTLEQLAGEEAFNTQLKKFVFASGR